MTTLKMTPDNLAPYNPNLDPRYLARSLYWQGWRISAIGRHLGIKPATVHSWKQRENWDGGSPAQRVATSAEARMVQLIHLPKKSDGDYKEIRQLQALINGFSGNPRSTAATVPDTADVGKALPDVPTIDNPPREKPERRGRARKNEKPEQNFFEPEQFKRVQEIYREQMFGYQVTWMECGKKARFRNVLKSRQIGATFFFAREALIDALVTGRNQIFLSASRAQAFQFKLYITDLAAMVGVELKGDVIRLPNSGAKLYFLGTNSRTAQGRHGNLYVDEYFWIPDFQKLKDLASPMASQKQYRITYFSTPSTEAHEAYPFWTGALYNEERPRSEHIKLDVSPAALAAPRLDSDGQTRQIVTLDDAERGGCNLFDRDYLLKEYSPARFRQLFCCEFVADGDAIFDYQTLMRAGVDSWDEWTGIFNHLAPRPCGNNPVWIGYDPADTGDSAGLVVAMAPLKNGDPFRIVERVQLHGNNFEQQAEEIKRRMGLYHVTKIVIDTGGLGAAVYQLVMKFFPLVVGMKYTTDIKALMVNKALNLFRANRVQWDAGDKDMIISFSGIRRTLTPHSHQMTYVANRSKAASHCDLAWAAMMIFYQEPMDGNIERGSSFEVI